MVRVRNHQWARLNRWVLKLSEYDFEIQQGPSSKHINADVLSRHVAAAVRKQEGTDTEDEAEVEVSLSRTHLAEPWTKMNFVSKL